MRAGAPEPEVRTAVPERRFASLFAGEPIDPRAALAVAGQDRSEGRKHGGEFALQHPWRIDDDEPASGEAVAVARLRNRQLGAQDLCNGAPLESSRKGVGLAAVLDRIPQHIGTGW